MRWPWSKPQTRASAPYTDAIISSIVSAAGGTATGNPGAIAALETAAGLWARAMQAATLAPDIPAITPSILGLIARDLIRRGESVFALEVEGGIPVLRPAGSWDVRGSWREADWWYRLDLFGPSGNVTRFVPSDAVCHFRFAIDPARPWLGLGPLQWARLTGTLAANLELRLGEEAGAPVGHLLPVPASGAAEGDDDPLADLESDMVKAKGSTLTVETTAGGFDEGRDAAPRRDWETKRYGADPPQVLPTLRTEAGLAVLNACGVPVSLATDADGTSQRESWRRFIMGSVEPVARMVAQEIASKLDAPGLRFGFDSLWAHDLAGRAASFKAMVTAGMEIERAVALSGLGADE